MAKMLENYIVFFDDAINYFSHVPRTNVKNNKVLRIYLL